MTQTGLKAQTGVPDTLAYLQTIVQNKAQYIGQPFAKLLDSLQIKIKLFFPIADLPYNRFKETSTSFSFFFTAAADDLYLSYPMLEVIWQTPGNADQSRQLRKQYRNLGWNSLIADHYSSKIIADIYISH
jgi:hypothetical protein